MAANESPLLNALLEEQYRSAEAYANAQSRLYNAASWRGTGAGGSGDDDYDDDGLVAAAEDLARRREGVRSNLVLLKRHQQQRRDDHLEAHLSLSGRVAETLFSNPSWHRNGIPSSRASMETSTVALASLKASIARVLESDG